MLILLLIVTALLGLPDSNHGQQHIQADVTLVNPAQKDFYDKGIFWANVVLAMVGIAGIGVGLSTLLKIERQTKSIESQVKSQMDADRAWIMVEARFESGGGISYSMEETMANVEIIVSNTGPTPAWVYEQRVQLEISPEIKASRTTYPPPQYPMEGDGRIFHVNYGIFPIASGQEPVIWRAFVRDKGFATGTNGLHAYVHGVVRYRDAFKSLRETYFGYIVVGNNRLLRIPNDAYNRHT